MMILCNTGHVWAGLDALSRSYRQQTTPAIGETQSHYVDYSAINVTYSVKRVVAEIEYNCLSGALLSICAHNGEGEQFAKLSAIAVTPQVGGYETTWWFELMTPEAEWQ